MLSAEQNELLCRVGPGTAMGNLIRCYWIPALESGELVADGPPVRVRLLGEDLIAFRSTSGRVGMLRNACPHRGASLFFGRNEDEGLRCAYHGWKFDCVGSCVDMPNVPAERDFKEKVRAVAYLCSERNGLVWTYMGAGPPPPLPELEANMLTDCRVSVRRVLRNCNWVQALEGDIDSSHLTFAHRRSIPKGSEFHVEVPSRYVILDNEVGSSCAALVDIREGICFCLISHFLFPFYVMVPFGDLGGKEVGVRCWVPLDDEHTMYWDILVLTEATGRFLQWTACEYLPASSDPLSRFRPVQYSANDYLLDRDVQKSTNFMGVSLNNAIIEDQALTESMGPICDRSHEHLGFADAMIIRTRRCLLDAACELDSKGLLPPGVKEPGGYLRRAVKMVLTCNADIFAAAEPLIMQARRSD